MSALYEARAKTAERMLKKYGAPVAFTRLTDNVRNPVNGEVITPGTTTVYSPKGIFLSIEAKLVDGTLTQAGDKELVIDGTFEPLMTDRLVGWSIQSIDTVKPTDTIIVSFIRVRK